MTNIGNIAASAFAAKNENTVALASLNFDFSLFKLEAPTEFRQLGNALSSWRRSAAESGTAHRTARKLGALFEQVATISDSLYTAYGRRVSEISESDLLSIQDRKKYGLFEGQAGADGTSIWAAATSGKTAMAVNLLACMLARLWGPAQATSIWTQLVEARKEQIHQECDGSEPSHLPRLAAAQQEITRKELAEWDSSARSWISCADKAKSAQHRKMEGLLQDISLPVDISHDVSTGVMRAWITAMSTMSNLIQGMPHRADGAVLLAMSAWHLYADVEMFGTRKKCVFFGDQLIQQGGFLTVGLEGNDETSRGVHWSLSLSRLKFYGDAVIMTVSSTDESKVSLDDFTLIALGGLFGAWSSETFNARLEFMEGARLIVKLWEVLQEAATKDHAVRDFITLSDNWMRILVSASQSLIEAGPEELPRLRRLALLGIRKAKHLLGRTPPPPFFGLVDPSNFFSILFDDRSIRAGALRLVAQLRDLGRYKPLLSYKSVTDGTMEYATAVPFYRQTLKRRHNGESVSASGHVRWISRNISKNLCNCVEGCRQLFCSCRRSGIRCRDSCHPKSSIECQNNSLPTFELRKREIERHGELCVEYDPKTIMMEGQYVKWYNPPIYLDSEADPPADGNDAVFATSPNPESPICDVREPEAGGSQDMLSWEETVLDLDNFFDDTDRRRRRYVSILGKAEDTALLVLDDPDKDEPYDWAASKLLISEMLKLLDGGFVDAAKILPFLVREFKGEKTRPGELDGGGAISKTFLSSVKILGAASRIYKLLPGAPVSLRIMERSLNASKWAQGMQVGDRSSVSGIFSSFKLDRRQSLACVSAFHTGSLDMPASELQNVLAVSIGNSIYAVSAILSDPYERCDDGEIFHIVGNIGRPGVTMLIPPSSPRMSQPAFEKWKVINHAPFDSTCGNHFGETSMHLTFTGYDVPVGSTVQHGAQDVEAQYVEAVVKVFDGQTWIADLDILAGLDSSCLNRLSPPLRCSHSRSSEVQWTSIDAWDELIDAPDETSIVRAHGNKFARLAAVVIAIQKGLKKCLVLPPEVGCYSCIKDIVGDSDGTQVVLVC